MQRPPEDHPRTRRRRLPVVTACALLWALAAATFAEAPAPAAPTDAAAPQTEIVVEGRHEGPRMWLVPKGDYTLLIPGTIAPLPKEMVVRPDAVVHVGGQGLGGGHPGPGSGASVNLTAPPG